MSLATAFVCDFDGTLYHHDKTPAISVADADAISAFRASGGRVGVSSSRTPHAIMLQAQGIAFDFFVSVGGALVTDGAGEAIYARRIPFDVVVWAQGAYARRAEAVVIAAGRDLYSVGSRGHHIIRDVASLTELPHDLYGVTIAMGTEDGAQAVARKVNDALGGIARATPNGGGVDVVAADVSKASAIDKVRIAFNLGLVGAMGDAPNDHGLLCAADVAYTVPGAPPHLVGATDGVMPDVASALVNFADRVNGIEQV